MSEGEEATAEAAEAAGVGLAVHKRARAGGLGRMKDYGKRQAEVPNPYAPPQVRGWGCVSVFV